MGCPGGWPETKRSGRLCGPLLRWCSRRRGRSWIKIRRARIRWCWRMRRLMARAAAAPRHPPWPWGARRWTAARREALGRRNALGRSGLRSPAFSAAPLRYNRTPMPVAYTLNLTPYTQAPLAFVWVTMAARLVSDSGPGVRVRVCGAWMRVCGLRFGGVGCGDSVPKFLCAAGRLARERQCPPCLGLRVQCSGGSGFRV